MDLAKLDRRMFLVVITIASLDIGLVVVALTEHAYYDALKTPIIILTVISLIACLAGYKVNKKYLEQPDYVD